MRFWAFECSFVVNNNLVMGEVFVAATRKELLSAMKAFFRVPRARILLADVLGAYLVDDGVVNRFHPAKPFVRVAIAKKEMPFEEAAEALTGDLDGAISRVYLAKGKAGSSDAKESDEDDDEDPVLEPFTFELDAKGFLAKLPEVDGEPIPAGRVVELVRPVGLDGYSASDDALHHPNAHVGQGWSDAEVDDRGGPFDPKTRFKRDLDLPCA